MSAAAAAVALCASSAVAGETEAYQHLIERMDAYQQAQQPRLIESFAPPYLPGDYDSPKRAYVYDNALAAMLFTHRGTPDDLRRAKLICDALLWYQRHDTFADGRVRQAYSVDQDLSTAAASARPKYGSTLTNAGEVAWVGLAWLTYYERTRDAAYLTAAQNAAQFLVNRFRDPALAGWFSTLQEKPEMTVGVPLSAYGSLTKLATTIRIPLSNFASQGLNLERLRAVSLVFKDPQSQTGAVSFQSIRFVNATTGAALTVDDFADTNPVRNALGFQIGGIVDISADVTGRTLKWNSADGSIDWWYSLLFDAQNAPGNRLDTSPYTHLELVLAGASGGERFTVELQGYPLAEDLIAAKSAEHNLDAHVFFMRLFDLTGNAAWKAYADEAKRFVESSAWDPAERKFWAGTVDAAGTLNRANLVEDVQSWGLLALGQVSKYGGALTWAEQRLGLSSDGFSGFDFGVNVDPNAGQWYSPAPDGVWFEGTAHMAAAYEVSRSSGGVDYSSYYLNELDRAQQSAKNANGKALVAASHDGVTTGFPNFTYAAVRHVGATAWYLAAKRRYNPLWNTSTDAPVPHAFDFSLTHNPPRSDIFVKAGLTGSTQIDLWRLEGSEQVVFSVSGLPSGATASVSPSSCSPNCSPTVAVTTQRSTPIGSYTVIVTGKGGGVTRATSFYMTVSAPVVITETPWQTNAYGTLYTNLSGNYARGYHFTPLLNGKITGLGGFFNGAKTVKLFNKSTGKLLASATVSAANAWSFTPITAVPVQAGSTYTVAVYLAGSGGSRRSSLSPALPKTFGSVRIDASTYIYTGSNAAARPTNSVTSTMYGQTDIRFVAD